MKPKRRVRVNHQRSNLKSHYDFIVCGGARSATAHYCPEGVFHRKRLSQQEEQGISSYLTREALCLVGGLTESNKPRCKATSLNIAKSHE